MTLLAAGVTKFFFYLEIYGNDDYTSYIILWTVAYRKISPEQ